MSIAKIEWLEALLQQNVLLGDNESSQDEDSVEPSHYRYIDLALANQVSRYQQELQQSSGLSEQQMSLLAALVVELSYQLSRGHVALHLSDFNFMLRLKNLSSLEQLTQQQLEELLLKSELVACLPKQQDVLARALLVFDQGRLYFSRQWHNQQILLDGIEQRLAPLTFSKSQNKYIGEQLNQLFSQQSLQLDWQKIAAANALYNRFSVIAGGPGTGKTTTVTKLLAALLSVDQQTHIAMAAPTGKAAARLTESIRAAKSRLAESFAVAELIPEQSYTLHRLLGWTPKGFKYHKDNPLPYDVVLIDEASMVDMTMMAKLFSALSAKTRIILLGDKDQLSSVEAGSVLADIADANGREDLNSSARLSLLAQVCKLSTSQQKQLQVQPRSELICDAISRLRVSYRFDDQAPIGQLAKAVNQQDLASCLQLLNNSEQIEGIQCCWLAEEDSQEQDDPLWQQVMVSGFSNYLNLIKRYSELLKLSSQSQKKQKVTGLTDQQVVEIFSAFNSYRVLAATRQGSLGVEGLNYTIEQMLKSQGLIHTPKGQELWYSGKPIMISQNDYALGLFNGDVGLLLPDSTGQLKVYFENSDGSVRHFLATRLPQHETAYAMTIHKSQGSEFDRVLTVFPKRFNPVLSKELLYTALTRAKSQFDLVINQKVLKQTLQKKIHRESGLSEKLWASDDNKTDEHLSVSQDAINIGDNLDLF